MLVELVIENYAVIERLRVRFHEGLNVLTGETGSGKSIVVDAVGLLLGGRASAEMVRSGAERARIAGIFEFASERGARQKLEEHGIETEDGEVLIEREILANGKSRAFLGSRPVAAAVLRELAPLLGDIHGQHEQQRLFDTEAQLDMLDSFSGGSAQELRRQVAEAFEGWRACATELKELERAEQDKGRLLDLWMYQRKEIEDAAIQSGEDAELETERRILQNVTRLEESASAAYAALYDDAHSAMAQLRLAMRKLDDLSRIDSSFVELAEPLKPAAVAIEDASYTLRSYLGKLEADPQRLETVESRLATLDRIKRKYGPSLEEVLAFLETVRNQIGAVESAEERRAEIERRRSALAARYQELAGELTRKRQESARKLEKKVESELRPLAMERAVFRVSIHEREWSADGVDAVEFLLSANTGEDPKALDRIASGGELSRVALALKTSVAGPKQNRTMVFDEVDAGIGGAAAEAVGRRLKRLGESAQVLCVTHLAQIAGFAGHHFSVEKQESKGRTVTVIEELHGDGRVREVGRMLAGQRLTPEALRHAQQLLEFSAAEE